MRFLMSWTLSRKEKLMIPLIFIKRTEEYRMCHNLKALMKYQAEQIAQFLKKNNITELSEKEWRAFDLIRDKSEDWRSVYCGGICPFKNVCKENRWLKKC